MEQENKKQTNILALCALSLLAGGMNGFLGTGGGIIFVYMLSHFTGNDKKDNFATTLCACIPISLVSAISYAKSGNIDTDALKSLILPAIVGGALGALLTDKIKTKYISLCFSALVIYSGLSMVMR